MKQERSNTYSIKHFLHFGALFAGLLILLSMANAASAQVITGDPWKMLVLVYRNIDTDYIDIDGQAKHLTATMPLQEAQNMVDSFLNQPHRSHVYDYSDHTAELEAHIEYIDRPLTDLDAIGTGYWPSPNVVAPELEQLAPPGKYDSVIVFWQPTNPDTGQAIPITAFGLGEWLSWGNGMTYAAVINIPWVFDTDVCEGEVFLHEWLHGVTAFYMSLGFPFPPYDLHGGEEAGYTPSPQGCWETWLRDYMRGLVYVNGQRTALVPETWQSGSITTHDIQGWRGEYYNNETLDDLPVMVRDDAQLNFQWGEGSPHPLVQADYFSVRWTRDYTFDGGHYLFKLFGDDGLRLYMDDSLVFDNWVGGSGWHFVDINVAPGSHILKMEYHENADVAGASIDWLKLPGAHEVEGNNTPGAANPITDFSHGFIDPAADVDYYRFTGTAGQQMTAEISAQVDGSSLNSVLTLYDSDGTSVLDQNDDQQGVTSDSRIVYTLPHNGSYYLAVKAHANTGGPGQWYSLGLTLGQSSGPTYLVSPSTNRKIGPIRAAPADILSYQKDSDTWTLVYDGSVRGTPKNLHAFDVLDDGSILMVFSGNQRIPGLGTATPFDVVEFTPDTPGVYPLGSGAYTWFFRGKTEGLTTSSEKIDAIDLVGDRLLMSTVGTAKVNLSPKGTLRAADEDVFVYDLSSDEWESALLIDGSKIAGMAAEDINGISYDPASDEYYVTILGSFKLGSVKGSGKSIVKLVPNGGATEYTPSLMNWLAPGTKFPSNLDGLDVVR